jgi:A/G-specific adenine glycosylase
MNMQAYRAACMCHRLPPSAFGTFPRFAGEGNAARRNLEILPPLAGERWRQPEGGEAKLATRASGERGLPIAPRLLRWYAKHGRSNLPWQHPRSAYRVWLSEVMLQQTRSRRSFHTFCALWKSSRTWQRWPQRRSTTCSRSGQALGYYSRARNLQRTAQLCAAQHGGDLPSDFDELAALPGIGRSTAGAILAQAHGLRFPILDGNVKRVLARWRGIEGWPGTSAANGKLWTIAESQTPRRRIVD